MDWRELQALNNERAGIIEPEDNTVPNWLKSAASDEYTRRHIEDITSRSASPQARKNTWYDIYNSAALEQPYTTEDVLESGYGDEKIDYRIPYNEWIANPANARANEQTDFEKIRNGIGKMGVYATTTFADNTAGLVAGIAGIANDLLNNDGEVHPGRSFREGLGFADAMQAIRDWSEEVLPNYRTEEEIEDADQWWKHLNANFWGDTVLKNLGFTIGAGASFGAFSKLPKIIQAKIADKGYKAAVAAATGDAEANAAIRNVLKGGAMKNPAEVVKQLERTEKMFNRLGWESQVVGGIGGALGEARMEALMAARESRDESANSIIEKYEYGKNALMESMMSNSDYVQFIGDQPVLTEAGAYYLEKGLDNLRKEYDSAMHQAEVEAEDVAKRVFGLNMLILPASNIIMFGRMASGGFQTQAKAKLKLNGNAYSGVGSFGRGLVKGVGNAVTEGMEEVTQKVFSEGAKDIAKHNMAAFNNGQYDKEAIKETSELIMSMLGSAENVIADPTTWEEFAVGFLTGSLGMPSIRNGGIKNWSGGIIGGVQESLEERREGDKMAAALNKIISDPGFQDKWKDIVRHKHYDNIKDISLSEDNKFIWKTAEDSQMLSDVLAFARAGKLNDLEALVDSFGDVDKEDIWKIRSTFFDDTDKNFQNKSDEDVYDWLQQRVSDVKDTINQYRKFNESLDFLSQGTISDAASEELLHTYSQLENFEKRYNDILNNVISDIRPRLEVVAQKVDKSGNATEDAKKAQKLLSSESTLTTLFGGIAADFRNENEHAIKIDDAHQKQVLALLDSLGVFADKPEIKKEVEDLQSLVRGRQEYYSRLFDPKGREQFLKKFEEQAETPETTAKELNNDIARKAVEGLDTPDAVKLAYFKKNAKERIEFLNNLASVEDSNPAVKSFMNLKRRHDEFKAYLDKNGLNVDNVTVTPPMLNSIVNDLIRRAKTEDELTSLPDSVFPSYEEFAKDHSNIFGPPSESTLFSIKQALRDAMNAYMGVDTATASRKSVSPTPVQQQPATGVVSTPEGYDAAQPASMEPQPEPSNNVIEKPKDTANNAKRERTIPYDALRDILTRKGRADGDLRHQANELPDKWHENLYLAVKSDNDNERKNAISELIKLSENNKGNAAADAVLSAIIYEDVEQQNDNERMQSNPTVQDVTPQQPTEETLLADAADAIVEDLPKDIEGERVANHGKKPMIAYLRTSMPETSTEQSRIARDAFSEKDRDALKGVDLSNFPEYLLHQIDKLKEELNKEKDTAKCKNIKEEIKLLQKQYDDFLPTWNALNERGAFNATATILDVGDKIEFVVDPTFPSYDGMYQILLTIVKDGQRIPLNLLSRQTDKYYNLSELHKAIDDEYQKFKEEHPNELFVFSKKSNVWAKRAGVIDYDFSRKEEKGIAQIQGYSDDAPIAFIDRNGNPVAVRGDKDTVNHVSIDFCDPSRNRGDIDGIGRRGNLYYLSKTDKDSYIPIRLNVEHFNEENIDIDNNVFNDIRKSLENIADIVRQANNTNLETQNKSLHSEIEKLVKNLDLTGIFFEIGDYENVGVALRVNDGKDSFIRRPDQMTDEWLTNLIASFDRSIQIKLDENGKIQNLDRYIENDILTSNARMLRQKGVDFYFDTWDSGLEEFAPATNAIAEIEKKESAPATINSTDTIPNNLDSSFDNMFGDPSGFFDSLDTSVVVKENNVPLLTAYQSMHINELKQVLENVSDEINKIKASKEGSERGGVQNSDVGLRQLMDRRERIEKEISAREQRRRDWDRILGSSEGFVGSEKIKALFNSLNKDKSLGEFFERVISIADSVGTKYELGEVRENNLAETKYSGKIIFDLDRLASTKLSEQRVAETIVHELVHNATISMMAQYVVNPEALSTEQKNAVTEIEDIYTYVSNYLRYNNIDDSRIYKLMRSPQEMVAGVVSPNFREFLKNVDGENFWQRLVRAIKQLLGITKNNYKPTMLDRLDNAVDNLLNNFSSEIYEDMLTFDPSSARRSGLTNEGVFDILSRNEKVFDRSYEPGSNKFSDLSPSTMEQLVQKGYSEQEWNNTPEVLRDKILRCL